MTRDASAPLNAAVPHAMWLGPGAVASNAGYPGGIAVRAGDSLKLSLFVYVAAGPVSIEARLVDGLDGDGATLASARVASNAPARPRWIPLRANLTATASSGAGGCRFQLRATAGAGAGVEVRVGATVVSLFPAETWMQRANGLRTDVAAWLNETQPAVLRTPGGCYVEGNSLANGWDWKQTLGPIEDRPGHANDVWGYWDDDGMGMFEYLQMADDVGARPLLVVNAGCGTGQGSCVSGPALQPYIQGALDAVEYATGDAATTWGSKRAAAGRAAPYRLEALGIGNENCGARTGQQYPHNWYTIATAVKARHPGLKLILGCETQEQMQAMLQAEPRIASLADMYDVHQRKTPDEMLAAAHEFDTAPRTKYPKVFVSEYSSPRHVFPNSTNLGAAVAEAVYMAGMEANADVVQLATYGDLMANSDDTHGSAGVSTILINAATSFGSPSWVVQKLFMHAQPSALVPSTLTMAPTPPPGPAVGVGIPGCCGGPRYTARAVQFHPSGGQFDFVWLSTRTPHAAYVWCLTARRNQEKDPPEKYYRSFSCAGTRRRVRTATCTGAATLTPAR